MPIPLETLLRRLDRIEALLRTILDDEGHRPRAFPSLSPCDFPMPVEDECGCARCVADRQAAEDEARHLIPFDTAAAIASGHHFALPDDDYEEAKA